MSHAVESHSLCTLLLYYMLFDSYAFASN